LIHIKVFIVESNEGLSATAEGNLVGTVIPPVGEASTSSDVPKRDHLEDLAPAVLANPTIAATAILQ
jgi:hypothetical protein